MNYIFHPDAKNELKSSARYYENLQHGLGQHFLDEIQKTILLILEYPKAWPVLSKRTRRCLVNKFPFCIIYQKIDDNIIRIISVKHINREPGYCGNRLDDDQI